MLYLPSCSSPLDCLQLKNMLISHKHDACVTGEKTAATCHHPQNFCLLNLRFSISVYIRDQALVDLYHHLSLSLN